MIQQFTAGAAEAYSRIITRYPLMDRTDDAKARLTALHQPVPKPTKAAVAQNRAEENSRKEASAMTRVMSAFQKHPNTAPASRVGEPTLIDPRATTASEVIRSATNAAMGTSTHSASVETINGVGAPPADQPAPRSDTPAAEIPVVSTTGNSAATPTDAAGSSPLTPANAAPDPNELKPDAAAVPDPNELKPNVSSSQSDSGQNPPAAPAQVNEIQSGSNGGSGQAGTDGSSSSSADQNADAQDLSSSKHKKKKGLGKLNPF
jgi:outer membrane protein assembly factor BamD